MAGVDMQGSSSAAAQLGSLGGTTSSMPWKYQGRSVLTAKDLRAGIVGKTGKIGAICYQFATKIREWVPGLIGGGSAPFSCIRIIAS